MMKKKMIEVVDKNLKSKYKYIKKLLMEMEEKISFYLENLDSIDNDKFSILLLIYIYLNHAYEYNDIE